MKDYLKIRILQGLLFAFSIFGIIFFDKSYIVLGLITYVFLETFGGNIGLHGYFCHNSFKTCNLIRNILILVVRMKTNDLLVRLLVRSLYVVYFFHCVVIF